VVAHGVGDVQIWFIHRMGVGLYFSTMFFPMFVLFSLEEYLEE
jgi:hypothetical protein